MPAGECQLPELNVMSNRTRAEVKAECDAARKSARR